MTGVDHEQPAVPEHPPALVHELQRLIHVLKDIECTDDDGLPILERPGEDIQIVHHVHAGEGHYVNVGPAFHGQRPAPQVDLVFLHACSYLGRNQLAGHRPSRTYRGQVPSTSTGTSLVPMCHPSA